MAGARFDASREVRKITSPTLVIHGADDCYVPIANARALAKAIPSAKLHVLERAAHLVFIEQAEEVNKHVVSFLKPLKARRRQKPKELPAPHKAAFLFEPRKGWNQTKVLAEQKTKQLVEWSEEAKKEITSSLRLTQPQRRPKAQRGSAKPKTKKLQKLSNKRGAPVVRKAQKAKESVASDKSTLWLHAARKAATSWEKPLRSWLSLSP